MAQATDTTDADAELAKSSRPATKWAPAPGPVSTEECLVCDDGPGAMLYLAPAGVPLQLPERLGSMMQWRYGRVKHGRLQDGPTACSIEEALEMAPTMSHWIRQQVRDQERRDLMVEHRGLPPASAPIRAPLRELSSATMLPDRQSLPSLTTSASRFAEILHAMPSDSPMVQVEQLVGSAISAAHLAGELDILAFAIGRLATRELVLSLIHARSRSRSWRSTWLFGVIRQRTATQRALEELIDGAASARGLLRSLDSLELSEQEVDGALVDLLFARSRSLRWRMTHPARRLLGSRRLSGARGTVRSAQARYAFFRNADAAHEAHTVP